jgi:hypothetical protein
VTLLATPLSWNAGRSSERAKSIVAKSSFIGIPFLSFCFSLSMSLYLYVSLSLRLFISASLCLSICARHLYVSLSLPVTHPSSLSLCVSDLRQTRRASLVKSSDENAQKVSPEMIVPDHVVVAAQARTNRSRTGLPLFCRA